MLSLLLDPRVISIVLLVIVSLRLALRRPKRHSRLWLPLIGLAINVFLALPCWQLMVESARNSSPGALVFALLFAIFVFGAALGVIVITMRLLVRGGVLAPRDDPSQTPRPSTRGRWLWLLALAVGCVMIAIFVHNVRDLLVALDEAHQALESKTAQRSNSRVRARVTTIPVTPTPERAKTVPLVLTLESNKSVYEEGEPILITVATTNISRANVSVFTRDFHPPLPLLQEGICDVHRSNGERILTGIPTQPPPAARGEFVTLGPDESLSWSFDLYHSPMDRLAPDTYRITYHYIGIDSYIENSTTNEVAYPWVGEVVSNELTVQVVTKQAPVHY